jgi:hypothetical protein
VILFALVGLAGLHFFGLEWAPPTAILIGLVIAPAVPLPVKKD